MKRRRIPPAKTRLFTHTQKSTGIKDKVRSLFSSISHCDFCSMRGHAQCEFPGCGKFMCTKHTTVKGGGALCPDHKGARLLQDHAHPDPGSVAILSNAVHKYKPKGPALPNPEHRPHVKAV